ncbi:2-oxoacid:acceptor oxidoreductase family protein [Chloroflexota bacterium]
MAKGSPVKHEVMMAGTGGQGVILVGQILAQAAMGVYEQVTFSPLYDFFKRGGVTECTVIMANEEITSPILSMVGTVVVMEPPQLKLYEGKVRPGGVLILEKAGLSEKVERDDIKVVEIPAVETASRLRKTQVANIVVLGAYVGVTGVLPPDVVKSELSRRFEVKAEMMAINEKAFDEGIKLALSLAV